MTEPASDRSRHVVVDVSEARIARLWGNVSARLERPRGARRWMMGALAAGTLAAAAGVAVVHFRSPSELASPSVWEGARLETAADRMSVSLVDGSRLTLDPNSQVAVQDRSTSAVKLVVERGRLACDVTHREGRSFVVVAGGVEVRVVGTLFSVASERAEGAVRVEVNVERGAVEVRAPGESSVARVEAGHSWSQLTRVQTAAASSAPSSAAAPAPSAAEPVPSAGMELSVPAPGASAAALTVAPPSNSRRALQVAPAASSSASPSARELFEQASGLWRDGRPAEAAQAYQNLLSTYPRDARAGLAAFELGRLRMDRLGDLPGALKALERALTTAPGSSFREDALARIVRASSTLGNASRCNSAREQYLREFPNGVHRLSVTKACGL
ncbi:MAG TPA: FecR domain-containing protein [Polyangiaceae bacterium]|nr:FecR domain-containing protein [Polyangiaceae bacterium]